MNVLVIFDSKYGNTRVIAQEIGKGLEREAEVTLQEVADVRAISRELDLLVVGSPTQAHGVEQMMKDFLDGLSTESVQGMRVAVFDTRLKWPKLLSGSAAEGIAKRLERRGANLIDEPASFLVEGAEGPLVEGEAHRAEEWGKHLLQEMHMQA
jgi:flavodoxin